MGCDHEGVSPRERANGRRAATRAGPAARGLNDASRRGSYRRGGGEAHEAGRPGMARRTCRASVRVPRGDRPGSSAVLGEWHLEFARRADRHAQGTSDCRAGSGLAPNRVRGVLRLDRDPRRPSDSVSTLISRGPDGPAMRVVLGGTFDILHKGHEALLRTAFEGRPERVLIGLTTDRFARESRSGVNPYAARERNLKRFLTARKWGPAKIEPIDDPYGPADDLPDLDVIVVSAERHPVAIALNETRAAKGLRPLEIRAVPMLLAQDGLPIASRRIRAGVIDRTGRRLTPLRGRVGPLGRRWRGSQGFAASGRKRARSATSRNVGSIGTISRNPPC